MSNTIHLIGSAHLDPVWLWRYEEGLAEIKATFQSALDRLDEFDDFVFTMDPGRRLVGAGRLQYSLWGIVCPTGTVQPEILPGKIWDYLHSRV